jgi:putative tryptophan/tyrosine transport system substrate-binding protein
MTTQHLSPLTMLLSRHTRRREFITLLGGAAAGWPLAARAQQSAMPVIGFLGAASPDLWADRLCAFRDGLGETGYVERQNVVIEYRWAEGQYDRLPALASELIRRDVVAIAAPGSVAAVVAAKAATSTIPIVTTLAADPVAMGFVASLNRPGSNVTGIASLGVELGPKRLELLRELVPTATNIALLVNPANPTTATVSNDAQMVARKLGVQLHVLGASTERDFDTIFAKLAQLRASGLIITPDAVFTARSKQLAALALHNRVPAIYQFREFAAAGGLMSYGGNFTEPFHRVGGYIGRIVKREKAADLPVQQATQIELFINLSTANP